MKRLFAIITGILIIMAIHAIGSDDFVRVDGRQFYIGDCEYKFVGTNLWYAPILASEGEGGNRARLHRELDRLQEMGVDNLRILFGAEGEAGREYLITPVLQPEPGVYNDTLLKGFDYLLAELERRGMKAVVYLTNSWEWSGGYVTYLRWAGEGSEVLPLRDGYGNFTRHAAKFVTCDSAKAMLKKHIRTVVGRTSSVTGRLYTESPAIMAWQICNEPRAFAQESAPAFERWISETAALIKSLDPNHLVCTGSEGLVGCQLDIDMWKRIHDNPNIDYGTIHIWPMNWQWVSRENATDYVPAAISATRKYIDIHINNTEKPLVIEEFGYPRDGASCNSRDGVTARDEYYGYVFDSLKNNSAIAGVNFWGWGGEATTDGSMWNPTMPYTCDPAHEPQGFYSVFAGDTSTVDLIRKAAEGLRESK